jgi:hypothetical protein
MKLTKPYPHFNQTRQQSTYQSILPKQNSFYQSLTNMTTPSTHYFHSPYTVPTENILRPHQPNIKRQDIDILGAPIGSTSFTNDWIQNKFTSLTSEFSGIDAIPHLQSRWLLLWYCLRGKITYIAHSHLPLHPITLNLSH